VIDCRSHQTFEAGDLAAVIGDNAADGGRRPGYAGCRPLVHRTTPATSLSGIAGLNLFLTGTTRLQRICNPCGSVPQAAVSLEGWRPQDHTVLTDGHQAASVRRKATINASGESVNEATSRPTHLVGHFRLVLEGEVSCLARRPPKVGQASVAWPAPVQGPPSFNSASSPICWR
jgi:hypothetical protein